jgi:hypothetical protein
MDKGDVIRLYPELAAVLNGPPIGEASTRISGTFKIYSIFRLKKISQTYLHCLCFEERDNSFHVLPFKIKNIKLY